MREGAGDDDDDDQFGVRQSGNSNNAQDTETSGLLDLEQEIEGLHLLMAKIEKLPEGKKSNSDILAQLQRMIDQLEAERDATRDAQARKEAGLSITQPDEDDIEINLRDGAGGEQVADPSPRFVRHQCDMNGQPAPPIPPKNPARKEKRRLHVINLDKLIVPNSNEQAALNNIIDLIAFIDQSRAWIEPQILAHIAALEFDRSKVPKEITALTMKLDRLLEFRQELWRRAKVLAWSDDLAMQAVRQLITTATTSTNACKSHKSRPHSTEARVRVGGSAHSAVEEGDEVPQAMPGSFDDVSAPPLPARNPARVRGGGLSSPSSYGRDLDREIADLQRDLIRASRQFVACMSQVAPSNYLAGLEADMIERLAMRIQELHRRRNRLVFCVARVVDAQRLGCWD